MFTSKVVPLDAENVDTDQIVPARYLKVTDKDGLAEALFRDWRFEEDGSLKDPPFVLDRAGHGRPRDPARRRQLRRRLVARARAVGADRRGASGRSCRPASPTSSAATASRTGCCRSSSPPTSMRGCGPHRARPRRRADRRPRRGRASSCRTARRSTSTSIRSPSGCCSPAPTSSATSSRRSPRSRPGRRPTRRGSIRARAPERQSWVV